MAFVGSINADLRALIAELAPSWRGRPCYVACSGNFTVERLLHQAGLTEIHGSDVSLYSCVLGSTLAGTPIAVGLREDASCPWLAPYLEPGLPTVASLLLAMEYFKSAGRPEPYHRRIAEAYERHWSTLHARSLDKITRLLDGVRLTSFSPQDCVPFVEGIPEEAVVVGFPPTYCLAPRHRILTADLRWVSAGDVRVGDRLFAIDEEPSPGARCRRWRFADVTRSEPRMAKCVRVILENGEDVICTRDHPWLTDRYEVMWGAKKRWVKAEDLGGAWAWVNKPLSPWRESRSYEAGWLAGIYDGEGTLHASATNRGVGWAIGIAQKQGAVLDRAVERLKLDGFAVGVHGNRSDTMRHVMVNGGFAEVLRALGTYRPVRLLEKLQRINLATHAPSIRTQRPTKVRVSRVEPVGVCEVQSIATSTRTYVGDGYLMHNSSGYERLYAQIDETFAWQAPAYETFTPERFTRLCEVMQTKAAWLTMRDEPVDALAAACIGRFQTSGRAKPVFAYAGGGPIRTTSVTQKTEVVPWRRLAGPVVGPLRLVRLTAGQLNTLRSEYLAPGIAPAAAQVQLGIVTSTDDLIGALAFNSPQMLNGDHDVYMMSDFAVAPTLYPRLSKLVTAVALTTEVRTVLEQFLNTRVRRLGTHAFTTKPVSMKYRGLLTLRKRRKADGDRPAALYYTGDTGRWSLDGALAWWLTTHGACGSASSEAA